MKKKSVSRKSGRAHLLALDSDDPKKELEFEVRFQLSLTAEQRYKIMGKLFRERMKWVRAHDGKKAPSITARS